MANSPSDEHNSLNCLRGTLGLALLIQVVLASLILAQQATWLLGGPLLEISSLWVSDLERFVIYLAWDPFFPTLAILDAVMLAIFATNAGRQPLKRWQVVMAVCLTSLYILMLLTFLAAENWNSWLTGAAMPYIEQASSFWRPNLFYVHLTADPVAHALLWLGWVQVWSTSLAIFQREYRPVRLIHLLGLTAWVGLALMWWRLVSAQFNLALL